jgi:AcrR family transcriptional regulator
MAPRNIPGQRRVSRQAGPRTATTAAILDATRELLAVGGVHRLTIEGVAARSGVAKTTIYRRWRSKEDLALSALLEVIDRKEPRGRDRGSTKADLTAYVEQLIRNLHSGLYGRIIRGLASDIATDEKLARGYRERVLARRVGEIDTILRRRPKRGGALAAHRELTADLIFGPIYYRLLLSGKPLTRKFARQLVDAVLAYLAS